MLYRIQFTPPLSASGSCSAVQVLDLDAGSIYVTWALESSRGEESNSLERHVRDTEPGTPAFIPSQPARRAPASEVLHRHRVL